MISVKTTRPIAWNLFRISVSLVVGGPDAGASIWTIAPFPIPAHQTVHADFSHTAFRLTSPQGPRRLAHLIGVGKNTPSSPKTLLDEYRRMPRARTLCLPPPSP
jgi:hypothetical protein